jgi:streptogramin lyase
MTNAIVRFDPVTEKFETFPSSKRGAQVRQMLSVPASCGARNPATTGWSKLSIDAPHPAGSPDLC